MCDERDLVLDAGGGGVQAGLESGSRLLVAHCGDKAHGEPIVCRWKGCGGGAQGKG